MTSNIPEKIKKYSCNKCNYYTDSKKDYEKHLITKKHINLKTDDFKIQEKKYVCNCGKEYKFRQGLWVHKQKCIDIVEDKDKELNELLLKLLNENKDLQNRIVKQDNSIKELIKIYKKSI